MKKTLLLVEDNEPLRKTIESFLVDNDFNVSLAENGALAIKKATENPPDLILLDLGLPDMTGESVFREIKKYLPDVPVIFLTARNKTDDIVKGLNLGADDYIPKPFDESELIARINARLKIGSNEKILKVNDLILDREKILVTRAGKEISLTQREFLLLEFLIENKGRVVSRETILNKVWGYSSDIDSRAVDVYIGYLRKKIDKGFATELIHSLRGFGYILKTE